MPTRMDNSSKTTIARDVGDSGHRTITKDRASKINNRREAEEMPRTSAAETDSEVSFCF